MSSFISLGIRPFVYDDKFVEATQKPADCLKGDCHLLHCIEDWLKKYLIMSLNSTKEKAIFNDLMINHPPTQKNLVKLAEIFDKNQK